MSVYAAGDVFGRLTLLERVGADPYGNALWRCRCACGNQSVVRAYSAKRGDTQSCGCLTAEVLVARATHRMCKTSTYKAWTKMTERCRSPACKDFPRYGGRGITVCERWMSFENFLADMGQRPPSLTIDRIDNDGNYEPGNCRWADTRTQRRNSSTCKLTKEAAEQILRRLMRGESVSGIAREYGVWPNTITHVRDGRSWPDAFEAVHGRPPNSGAAGQGDTA